MPAARSEPRVCVARIGAPHGVRGEVKLFSFTADPLAVRDYGALESEDGATRFEITAMRPAKGHLVAAFAGINDRDAAERLTNVHLYVPRARLPAPAADEFYHADLIGLAAFDTGGAPLGTVIAIHNFGAGDLVEIAPAQGGTTVMVPFTEAAVPTIDIAGQRIVVDATAFAAASPPARSDPRTG
jgi:16S rRNA processing protein RimM